MTFKQKDRRGTYKKALLIFIGILIITVGGWLMLTRLEGTPPKISMELKSFVLPAQSEINGQVSDSQSGLSKLWIGLLKDGKETVLLEKNFTSRPKAGAVPFKISLNIRATGNFRRHRAT